MTNNRKLNINTILILVFCLTLLETSKAGRIPAIFTDYVSQQQESRISFVYRGMKRMLAKATKLNSDDDTKCKEQKDCASAFFVCKTKPKSDKGKTYDYKICIHKELWPLLPIEWVGSFLFSFIMLLSNVGGIGGGGIAIPMVQMFFGWDNLKKSIAISSFSIFMSTVTRFIFNFKERHPEKPNMSSLDYGLSNVMIPLTLIGTQVGAFVFLCCPALVINVLLTLLLLWLWIKAQMKACDIYKQEKKKEEEKKAAKAAAQSDTPAIEDDASGNQVAPEPEGGMTIPKNNKVTVQRDTSVSAISRDQSQIEGDKSAIMPDNLDEYGLPSELTGDAQKDSEIATLRVLIKQEKGHFIIFKQFINFFGLVVNVAMNILRKVVLDKCSAGDWSTITLFLILMIILVVIAVKKIATEQSMKEKYNNVNLVPSDLVFRSDILRNVLMLGFGGGFVAGALGLGGGVIFNPYLIGMGVPPRVSSATGMYLIMYSKVAAVTVYILAGYLDIQYGIWVAAWSCVGAVIGLYTSNWYMAKSGRQSPIVFSLAFILFLAVISQPTYNFILMAKDIENGKPVMNFKSICDA